MLLALLVITAGHPGASRPAPRPLFVAWSFAAPKDTTITLNDAYILGLRNMVDQEEIESARWATTHASAPSVKSFAQVLLRGHSSAQYTASALGTRLKIELRIPADTDSAIVRRHQTEMATLRQSSGSAFDRIFLTAVRDDHANEIAKVNTWFLPAAKSDSVKAYLNAIMPTLIKHRDSAAQLLASLPKAGTQR